MILSDQERLDWLRLIRSENIGPIVFDQLLEAFGSATDALEALPDLSRKGGLKRAIRICSSAEAQTELDSATAIGARAVAKREPDYPALLRHIDSAPPLIYIKGNAELLRRETIAIVGSRNASPAYSRQTLRAPASPSSRAWRAGSIPPHMRRLSPKVP